MAVVVAVEGPEHLLVGHSDGVADIAAGEGLAQHQNVGQDQISHEPVARAAKAGGHLVKDEQHVILVAQLPGPL